MKKSNNNMSMPSLALVDAKKVLRTRVIDFDFEFTRESCMEVVGVINKLIEFDKLMGTPDKNKTLRINVYSYGGHCDSLWSLIDRIEWLKANGYTVTTHNISVAMSCGFVLSIAGNVKTCTPYARYLNHQVSSGAIGTFGEVETYAEDFKQVQEAFVGYIRLNTDLSEFEIQRPYTTNRDVIYTAEEAVKMGVAHKIASYSN